MLNLGNPHEDVFTRAGFGYLVCRGSLCAGTCYNGSSTCCIGTSDTSALQGCAVCSCSFQGSRFRGSASRSQDADHASHL